MSDAKLLTPQEAAARLRMSPFTVQDWLRAGKLAGIKIGRKWLVPEPDLESFVAARRRERTEEALEGAETAGEKARREEGDDLSPNPCHMTMLGLVEALEEQLQKRQPIPARQEVTHAPLEYHQLGLGRPDTQHLYRSILVEPRSGPCATLVEG